MNITTTLRALWLLPLLTGGCCLKKPMHLFVQYEVNWSQSSGRSRQVVVNSILTLHLSHSSSNPTFFDSIIVT